MMNREELFRRDPMVAGFLSTALEDLQHNEREEAFSADREERDVGSIYTAPEATVRRAICECETFARDAGDAVTDSWQDMEAIGSDLYLERAGHGAGFQDRQHDSDPDTSREIGERLSAAVSPRGTLELYVGDDGAAWIVGAEA